jgi:3',5'-cyclic AMP phosphodiesterase CpdA
MKNLQYIKSTVVIVISILFFSIYPVEGNSEKIIPILQIPIISDIHIEPSLYKDEFIRALKDYKKIAPDYKVIGFVGDITNGGAIEQYDEFMKILNTYSNPDSERIITIGNHEFYEKREKANLMLSSKIYTDRFSEKTGMPGPYYDKWVKGYHFIALGSEGPEPGDISKIDYALLSEAQYRWLDKTLSINADSKKPIFVFLHQPIDNTVYGSKYCNGNLSDGRLVSILRKYPQIFLFSGHSHCILNHEGTVYQNGFTMVNTSAVSYTWLEESNSLQKYSQGLLVDVYEDRVDIKAREFTTGRWITTYTIKLP